MDYEYLANYLSWVHEPPDDTREDAETHFTYVRGDCVHLAENGGGCSPEHGGCPRDCPHYEPCFNSRRPGRVN